MAATYKRAAVESALQAKGFRRRESHHSYFVYCTEAGTKTDDVKTRLRQRAAGYGRSMEEEVRMILAEAGDREAAPERGLGTAIHELFKPFGGVELELPPREATREPPRLD